MRLTFFGSDDVYFCLSGGYQYEKVCRPSGIFRRQNFTLIQHRTNTYEESSLGLYESDEEIDENSDSSSYLGQHIKKQLAFDLWYVFLGVFLITIAEGDKIADLTDPVSVS